MPTYTEPDWGTPDHGDTKESTYDWAQITPLQFLGATTRLIQAHFSDAENIYKPELKKFIWTEDKKTTKIIIAPGYEEDLKVADPTMASIYIHRDDVKFTSAGELRKLRVTVDDQAYPDNNYLRVAMGKFIAVCQSRSATLAEYIGEEVLMRAMQFSPVITNDFRMFDFDVAGFGKVTVKEKSQPKIYYTAAVFQWTYMYTWKITDEALY